VADHYGLLGIDQYADDKEINTAYRQKIMGWHPDQSPPDKGKRYTALTEAKQVLLDPEKRADYNRIHGFGAEGFMIQINRILKGSYIEDYLTPPWEKE